MREYDINLIPADVLERETLIYRGKRWLFLAGAVLVFLLALNLVIKIMNNNSLKEMDALSSAGEMASGKGIQSQEIAVKGQELLKMRGKIGYLLQKGPVLGVFSSIDKAINHNIMLTHIEIMSQFPNMQNGINAAAGNESYFSNSTGVKMPGGKNNVLILRGMSQSNSDIAAMLAELSKNEIYTSVNLMYSRSGDLEDGMPINFEIECILNNVISVKE